jgi:hypothetical protein
VITKRGSDRFETFGRPRHRPLSKGRMSLSEAIPGSVGTGRRVDPNRGGNSPSSMTTVGVSTPSRRLVRYCAIRTSSCEARTLWAASGPGGTPTGLDHHPQQHADSAVAFTCIMRGPRRGAGDCLSYLRHRDGRVSVGWLSSVAQSSQRCELPAAALAQAAAQLVGLGPSTRSRTTSPRRLVRSSLRRPCLMTDTGPMCSCATALNVAAVQRDFILKRVRQCVQQWGGSPS